MRRAGILIIVAITGACAAGGSAFVPADGQADGGSPAGVGTDAGAIDPAPVAADGGVPDGGVPDAGVPDGGGSDAGIGTDGGSDAGVVADGGSTDAGVTTDGGTDAGGSTGGGGYGLLPSTADGWQAFAPRAPSAPLTSVSTGSDGYILKIAGGGVANVYGGWNTTVPGLRGSSYYRLGARARPAGIVSLRESVTIVVRWKGSFGEEVSPDYVWDFDQQADGTLVFDRTLLAPAGTTDVDVQLVLQWSAGGQVAFDRLSLAAAPAPASRKVRVASIYYRPDQTKSGLDSVQRAGNYAGQIATTYNPDVIVLGELLNVIGAPGTYDTDAETIPGPSTSFMAGIASAHHVNIAFGMVERSGDSLFNTAVLIDRNGNIIGKHRKVQLPLAEASGGLAPGDAVEVFDTDFGRVALLICQETSFPEPAREAALQGAELLLVPIWGGKTALVHARAVENGIYLAASGYDYASEVVDPLGTVLASAIINAGPKAAVADIDLGKRFREDWLGDWRDIASKERRAQPYQYKLP